MYKNSGTLCVIGLHATDVQDFETIWLCRCTIHLCCVIVLLAKLYSQTAVVSKIVMEKPALLDLTESADDAGGLDAKRSIVWDDPL